MSQDDGALLDACRSGNLGAAEQLINRRQRDLVRVGYLLTGDSSRAVEFASDALLKLLGDPPEHLDDPGQRLVLDVARRYLRNAPHSTWLQQQSKESYAVEDERDRIKGALDRLEPGQRAILALYYVAGLPESVIRQTLVDIDNRNDIQTAREQARSRVAMAAGRTADAPVIDLLNQVLVDAPSADLWAELEEPIRRTWSARRRSERLLTAAVVGGLLLVVAVALIWLTGYRPSLDGGDDVSIAETTRSTATPADVEPTPTTNMAAVVAAPTIPPWSEPAVSVRDLQLLRVIEQTGEGRSAIEIYNPALNTSRPLLEAGESVLISPNGEWIVSERNLPGEDGQSLLAATRLDQSESWELRLNSPSSWTVGNDRLYVLNLQQLDGRQIQVIDLLSGHVLEAWPVGGGNSMPSSLRWAMLILSPDEERLSLMTARTESDGRGWYRTLTIYESEGGKVLNVLDEEDNQNGAGDFSIRGSRRMPNENALYSIFEDEQAAVVRLQFLDLDTGETSGLRLPIQARSAVAANRREESEIHLVPSNTGALLYIVQSRQRQVAVVDMRSRSVVGVFPIAAGTDDQGALENNLNHVTYMETLLSPDGTWMYLAVNRERNLTINSYPSESPVWVVNTTTWEVTERWMVSGMPRSMTMSGSGARIYLRSIMPDRSLRLTAIDTSTGNIVDVWEDLPAPDWADVRHIMTVSQIYHEQHGIRPQTNEIVPRDNPVVSILPGVLVQAEDAVAGAETLVTTRIVHPVTGEPAAGDPSLRFNPDATIAIELSNGERQAILVPSRIEPGVYQGRARLDGPGKWDARVTVINPDGSIWTVTQQGAVDVAEGLRASDGGTYRFNVSPANPVNRRTITLRVWMVESQSGERLPEEIEFLDQISEDAEIVLTHPSGERVAEPLIRIDHASFLGWARFGEPGEWTAEIRFGLADGQRIAINAGTIQINDLTEPFQRSSPGGGSASTNTGTRMANPASQ